MSLAAGTPIGSYTIVGLLGAGGMGEVYRARDSKLDRDVALKLLPADVAADPQRLARFDREAKTLAALNHPHIAHVYGFEKANGVSALVMELVEGEDLSQRIACGALPVDEALPIARSLACGWPRALLYRALRPPHGSIRRDARRATIAFGEFHPLFGLPTPRWPNTSGFMYAVDPAGQRFLVSGPAVDLTLDPVTVVINGTAGIR